MGTGCQAVWDDGLLKVREASGRVFVKMCVKILRETVVESGENNSEFHGKMMTRCR